MRHISILFVCLGNICRSPLAEAALRASAGARGIPVTADSAGTGNWHVGKPPDHRAIAEAARHGIDISGLRARQVGLDDFQRFDLIVALDMANLDHLRGLRPDGTQARLSLLLDYVPGREGQGVIDPYYGGSEAFQRVWADVSAGAEGILDRLT